ncbi:DUF4129 domain-containing protein [Paenalkalicoccus suaedae]|uniref:DUF4129 domain-containing protein n=1 Tax=Paenalkalicoccus suaedae TaxID=2592382 RepID=A0A859FBM9_9BACI|nr:DUF4129 domain-containing protein [Paenalkalicoccus suaedae]QKS70447.1 DUF4129 domain-containing protein [Paenalkalicoccus suaedae]
MRKLWIILLITWSVILVITQPLFGAIVGIIFLAISMIRPIYLTIPIFSLGGLLFLAIPTLLLGVVAGPLAWLTVSCVLLISYIITVPTSYIRSVLPAFLLSVGTAALFGVLTLSTLSFIPFLSPLIGSLGETMSEPLLDDMVGFLSTELEVIEEEAEPVEELAEPTPAPVGQSLTREIAPYAIIVLVLVIGATLWLQLKYLKKRSLDAYRDPSAEAIIIEEAPLERVVSPRKKKAQTRHMRKGRKLEQLLAKHGYERPEAMPPSYWVKELPEHLDDVKRVYHTLDKVRYSNTPLTSEEQKALDDAYKNALNKLKQSS